MSEPPQQPTGDRSAQIVLTRPARAWVDRFRSYKVVVDGVPTGDSIRNGETISLSLTPGIHNLAVKIDWSGSKPLPLELRAAEIRRLKVEWRGDIFSTDGYLRLSEQG